VSSRFVVVSTGMTRPAERESTGTPRACAEASDPRYGSGGTAGLAPAVPSSVETFHDYTDYERARRERDGMRLPFVYRDPID
jgi:hypothetical protein